MASVGVPRLRREHASALAPGRSQWDLRSPRPRHSSAVYRVLSLVQTHDAAGDGGPVRCVYECGHDEPVGEDHDGGVSRTGGGGPRLCPRTERSASG